MSLFPAPITIDNRPPRETTCSKLTRYGTTLVTAATGLAMRLWTKIPLMQTAGTFFFGLGSQGVCSQVLREADNANRLSLKVLETVTGQVPLFAATQIYDNTDNEMIRTLCVNYIAFCLGARVWLVGERLYAERGMLRAPQETALLGQQGDDNRFGSLFLGREARLILKFAGGGACAISAVFTTDKVAKEVLMFFGSFLGASALGEIVETFLHRKVQKLESTDRQSQAKRLEVFIDVARTVGLVVVIPALFSPFDADPRSPARIAQLPIWGAVAGLFEGAFESERKRVVTSVSFSAMPFLSKARLPPGSFFAAWRKTAGVVSIASITGFFAWQVGWDLNDKIQRAAIGVFWGSFVSTLGLCAYADKWSKDNRSSLKDRLIVFLSDPRILSVPPHYLFFVMTNSLEMNDIALSEMPWHHQALSLAGWASYGHAMAFEFFSGITPRQLPWFARLFTINAVLTAHGQATGKLS